MKKAVSFILCLIMIFALLPPSAHAAGGVSINKTNFPDATFRSYVKQFDTNGNGYINSSELSKVTFLDCDKLGIKTFKGAEYFTNLQVFFCGGNDLTELDVSKNTELVSLDCSLNKLTSLDVTKNTELKELYCYSNQLTKLDVSRNTKLEKLFCEKNNIASLNIKNCPNILKDFQKGVQRKQDYGYLYSTEFKLIASGGGMEWYEIPHGLSVDKATKVSPTVKPGVKTQPWDTKVYEQDRATFEVKSTGGGQSYQWYYHTANDNTWRKVSINGTSPTYQLDTKARHNGNVYRCKITNASGSIYTKSVTLTVILPPVVTEQPKDVHAAAGDTVTFSVKATGEQLTYQWYYMNASSSGWKKVSINGTSPTYTLTVKPRHSGNIYYCDVTDMRGNNVFSEHARLTVYQAAPVIKDQPVDVTVKAGSSATFICGASEGMSYQWYYQKPGETGWNKVSINGTSRVYTLSAALARHNGYKYRCVVTNPLGSVQTETAKLTVVK